MCEVSGRDSLKENDRRSVDMLYKACRGEGPVPPEPEVQILAETPKSRKRKSDGGLADEPSAKKNNVFCLEPSQMEAIQAARSEFSQKPVAILSALLQKNGLPKSGKKEELVER